jgi:HK97 family phage major capsid protein
LGASALYAFYGDIKQAYRIVDRVGMKVLRDPFSSKPYVLFYTRKRVGGGVKNFEAYKIGKCST